MLRKLSNWLPSIAGSATPSGDVLAFAPMYILSASIHAYSFPSKFTVFAFNPTESFADIKALSSFALR